MDPKKWETMSESERNAMIDECFVYDDAAKERGFMSGTSRSTEGSPS
jgi:hypothetical protein